MIMIVKTPGSQMGSPAAAEGGGEAMGGGRGESGERSEVQARSMLMSTAPKARSRSKEVATLDEEPRISQRVSSGTPSSASSSLTWVTVYSVWTRESLHLHLRCRAAGLPDLLRDLACDHAAGSG